MLIGEPRMDFESDLEAIASVFMADIPQRYELWCGERLLGLFRAAAKLDRPGAPIVTYHDNEGRLV